MLMMFTLSLFLDCCHQRSLSEVQTETRSIGSKKRGGERALFPFIQKRKMMIMMLMSTAVTLLSIRPDHVWKPIAFTWGKIDNCM